MKPRFVYPWQRICYNDTFYHNAYEGEFEIELLQINRNLHKKSLANEDKAVRGCCKFNPPMFLLGVV